MSTMTPAEMREQAKRLRLSAGGYYERETRAGADALDCLADVIEWAADVPQVEKYPTFDAGWEEAALHVLDLARGEEPADDPRP